MNLNEKQLEVITRTAVMTALEHLEKEKMNQEKIRQDRRLRNIKLLLRNYRSFNYHCMDIKLDISSLNDKLVLDEIDSDTFAIRAIKRSKERTLIIVNFMNQMIKVFGIMCEQDTRLEVRRRYQVIYDLYLSESEMSVKDVSELQKINERTVYKDVDKACETLSVLMFGVDGLKLIG